MLSFGGISYFLSLCLELSMEILLGTSVDANKAYSLLLRSFEDLLRHDEVE